MLRANNTRRRRLSPEQEQNFYSMIDMLNASAPGPRQTGQSNPQSLGLFSDTFEPPTKTWADRLSLIGGRLMDLDGSFGAGFYDEARSAYDERVSQAREAFEAQRQRKLMEMAAQGNSQALFMLDPALGISERRDARDFEYMKDRDAVEDSRWQQGFDREGAWRDQDVAFRENRAARQDLADDRDYGLNERRFAWETSENNPANAAQAGNFGLSPIYGVDQSGRPVILQTSKAGGLIQAETPEGVTLTGDPRSRAREREIGTAEGKKAAYQTEAGLKVLAAEEAFDRVSQQIDKAIQLSNKGNTGLVGGRLPAPDLSALLETISANTAFETLVDLKSQGGTLGALSDNELNLLKAKVANLARSQSEAQLDANLEILKISLQNSLNRIKQAYEEMYAQGAYGAPQSVPQSGGQRTGRPGPSGQLPPPGFE